MSCYGCSSGFGLFRKEVGCSRCGFSFCPKCLSKETKKVQSATQGSGRFCHRCTAIMDGKLSDPSGRVSPPDAFKRRLAARGGLHGATGGGESRSTGDTDDMEGLRHKLEALSSDNSGIMVQSEDQLRERLRRLQERSPVPQSMATGGFSAIPSASSPTKFYHPPETRSQFEQATDLMKQSGAEVDMDQRVDKVGSYDAGARQPVDQSGAQPSQDSVDVLRLMEKARAETEKDANEAVRGLQADREIWERIGKLKGEDGSTRGGVGGLEADGAHGGVVRMEGSDSEEDEAAAAARIVRQALAEDEMDQRMEAAGYGDIVTKRNPGTSKKGKGPSSEAMDSDSDDELPYCIICNEDARIRCQDCDGDLYCKSCFKEGHREFDYKGHRSVKYRPPPSK